MSSFEELENMTPADIDKFKKNLGMNEKPTEATNSDSEQAPEQPQNNPENVSDSPEQRELLPEDIHQGFQKQLAEVAPVTKEVNILLDHVDGLDNEEPEVTERLNGVMSKITETIKHSNLLKAIITAGAFLAPTAAYGGELSNHSTRITTGMEDLQSNTNPHEAELEKIAKSPAMTQVNLKKLITPSGRLRTESSAYKKNSSTQLGRIHLNPSSRLFTTPNQHTLEMNNSINSINGVQMNTFRTNTLEKVNHFQKKILPGATINGSPVYEIAPGVYGNEHSQYGNGVHIGTMEINN